MKTKSSTRQPIRWLSFLLALILTLGCAPAPAHATDGSTPDTLTVGKIDILGTYKSDYLDTVTLRYIPVTLAGGTNSYIGFCYAHGAGLSLNGLPNKWTYSETLLPSETAAAPFLSWYAYHMSVGTWGGDSWTETSAATWVQAAVWLAQAGVLTDFNSEAQLKILAAEREKATNGYASPEESVVLFQQIVNGYKAGAYGSFVFNIYTHESSTIQPILVPYSKPKFDDYDVYIKLQKTANGSYHSGATFGIYADSNCQAELGRIVTTSAQWNYSNSIRLPNQASTATLYIKELSTGDSNLMLDTTVYSVFTDAAVHNSAANAAVVNGGASIVNKKITIPNASSVIQKVDGATGAGIGPATFALEGDAADGSYIKKSVTTDSAGNVALQWQNPSSANYIKPGYYMVTEEIPPANYEKSGESQYLKLWLEYDSDRDVYIPHHSGPIIFQNFANHSITFSKLSDTGKGLAGATYDVYHKGTLVHSGIKTSSSGTIVLNDVESGSWMFVEKSAPVGFLMSTLGRSASVYVDATDTSVANHHITMTNYEYPDIVIEKYSTGNKPLSGGVFEVTIDGTTLGTFKTNQAGVINITYAQYGEFLNPKNDSWTVRCEELEAPEGYFLAEKNWQENEIRKGQTLSPFVFINEACPSIVVEKQSTDGEPLANALFEVAIDATVMATFTTDKDGKIVIDYATYSRYLNDANNGWTIRVTELEPPAGYLLSEVNWQENQLRKGQSLSPFVFFNESKPNLEIIKYGTSGSGEDVLLSGVTYRIWPQGNETAYRDVKTDSKGRIFLESLDVGFWCLQEIATVSPYQLDDTIYTIELVAGQTTTHTAVNHRRPSLTVVKTCSVTGNRLSNAKFQLFSYAEDGSETDLGVFYTNEKGEIRLENLDPTRIKIVELEPKAGYAIPTGQGVQEVYLKLDEDKTVTFENVPLSAIVVHKTDTANPSNPLAGAVFELRYLGGDTSGSGGTVIGRYTTAESGSVVITGLKRGYYIIEEVIPPSGHALSSETTQSVFVSGYEQDIVTVTFRNQKNPGFLLIKRNAADKSTPLSGAVYRITDSGGATIGDNNGLFETGSDGTIYIPNLTPGMTLLVQEVSAPAGYALDDKVYTAKLTDTGDYELILYNEPLKSFVLTKLDAADEKTPLSEVEYYITYANGKAVDGGSNGTFVTDEHGKITISGLMDGDVLKIQETKAKDDSYILDGTVYTFVIGKDGNAKTFYNERKGGLLLLKRDSVTNALLSGVQYKITYADGAVVGNVNGIFTTNSKGEIRLYKRFEPGTTLLIYETKAKSGYLLDDTVHTITIKDPDTLYTITAYNTPVGGVEVIKLDASDNKTRIGGIEFEIRRMNGAYVGSYTTSKNGTFYTSLLPGWYTLTETDVGKSDYILDPTPINFEVKEGETTILRVKNEKATRILIHKTDALTGRGIPNVKYLLMDSGRNPLGIYETDQDGYIYIDKSEELTEGKYFLQELEAKGYVVDSQIRTVYLEAGKTTTIEWVNVPERGQIIVTKKSAAFNEVTNLPAGSLLAGSVFEVYSITGNLVDRMTSNASGIAASSLLPLGVYVVKEVSPSPYYALNTREFLAELRHNGDIVRFEVLNENVNLGVTIQKKSANAASNGQPLYYDLFGIANTSNVALESFYVHDRLPTDAVRGVTVWTGTWSHRLNYQVTYKTNYADYRMLASGLSTQTNYELSIHPNVLGLQSGEYVTDIRFEFGIVPVGFACVVNPKLQTQVLSTLPKGYKIVNRADVGGKYLDAWQTAQTSWTTLVYDNPTPAPNLPKTGY